MINADKAITEIRKCLKTYLQDVGVEIPTQGNFCCPIPGCGHRHGDRSPSAGFVPGTEETIVHCFSSGRSADIFHIFAGRERLPIQGRSFYDITLVQLAETLGVEYEPEALSTEQKAQYTRLRAYKDAALTISQYPNTHSEALIKARAWTVVTCQALMIGSVENFESYISQMKKLGWDKEYLRDNGLGNQSIFHQDNIIFTICSPDGSPIAFVARDTKHEEKVKNGQETQKYRNSSSEIYSKSNTIYNFQNAKSAALGGDIWLFEGYGDCVTAYQHGLRGACATGGTAFTEEHLVLLTTAGARQIIIAFDGDDEGTQAITRALDKHFGNSVPLNFRIVLIPDNMDPDEYIRANDLESFCALEQRTVFKWRLDMQDLPPADLAAATIPMILHEKDRIKRHFLARILSDATGVNFRRILDEVERREAKENSEQAGRLEYIRTTVLKKLQGGEPIENVIYDAGTRIEEVKRVAEADEQTYLGEIDDIKAKMLKPIHGFNFGVKDLNPILPELHKATDGLPRFGSLTVFSGIPGSGKTSFMRYLFYKIAMSNPDVRVVFMSIDDSKGKICQSLITLQQGISLPKVRKYTTLTIAEREKWEKGWIHIKDIMDRFQVYDSNDGTTLSALERYIRTSQDKYPTKQVVVILDNFHKLTDFVGQEDRTKHAYCASMIKNLTTKYDVPIFMTVELRKLLSMASRPTMNDLKDTVQISYDADMIWLLHNDLHVNPETALRWGSTTDDLLEKRECPIVELSIVKNKETGWKGTIFLEFEDRLTSFRECEDQKGWRTKQYERGTKNDPSGVASNLGSKFQSQRRS